ncbi:DUF4097 family beta strand repeat-containing protein [Streptomyces sp. N2A]|uniref:DUF4097 family beta strand repeat-containing protein n=1 Tax=Streptomyces sp. N2A TaxID=3073936 RepID=UPI0028701C22|nr:DUF4097 family beta strand repeat-containing protein [Streptomyces sp. N2A]
MPHFDFETPEPVSATVEFDIGAVRIIAGKRTDTVIEVLPADAADATDVRAAEQTKVTCAGGTLQVKGPRKRSLFGRSGSVDVRIELPAGSDVHGTSPMGDFHCTGRLGECRIKTSYGDVHVDEAHTAFLRTDLGDIHVSRVTGDAEVIAAGRIEVGEVEGAATVKNGNGATTIGEVTGDLTANSSNGRLSVGVAHGGVEAKTAHGGIHIGELVRGRANLLTATGDIEVGIRAATAAWLDVHTRLGGVRNTLTPFDGPGAGEETVEVRARTGVGNIEIRRA